MTDEELRAYVRHYSFPHRGWWSDRWVVWIECPIRKLLGYEYHIAQQKGEVTGWRKRVRTP